MDYTPQLAEILSKMTQQEIYFQQLCYYGRVLLIMGGCVCGVLVGAFVLWRIGRKDLF